jgi:hypothetical protein
MGDCYRNHDRLYEEETADLSKRWYTVGQTGSDQPRCTREEAIFKGQKSANELQHAVTIFAHSKEGDCEGDEFDMWVETTLLPKKW